MGKVASLERSKFALSLGDHFYFSGVRNVHDPRFRRTFERAFSAHSLSAPGFFRLVAGNHDHDGNVSAQIAYGDQQNSRWHFPALQHTWREPLPDEEGSTIAFALIDTVMLCGKPRKPPPVSAERHWRWVEETLASCADAAFLIVGGHYPVYSPAAHGPTPCLQERLLPLLKKYRVDIYLSGHDHALFHVGQKGDGNVQFHGVGAGFTTTASRKYAHTCGRQLQFHHRGGRLHIMSGGFAGVHVNTSTLTVSHYDSEGQILYTDERGRQLSRCRVHGSLTLG